MLNRRSILLTTMLSPLLGGCIYDRWLSFEWDEEVKLADGQVVTVHLKHTYERLRQGLTPHSGTIVPRDSTLTLNAGGTNVSQLFKGFHPMFLDRHGGTWYAVLYGDYYDRSRELPGQDWGTLEGPYGQWAIKLTDRKWQPISMSNLPKIFQEPNMLMLSGTVAELAQFDRKVVTLNDKQAWLAKHPLGYSDVRLTRPTATSPRRKDSASDNTSGR